MELNSGDDLISLKESLQCHYSPSTESPPSIGSAGEYARCNGLTTDYLVFDWQQLVGHDPAISATVDDLGPGELIGNDQLQECLFRAIIPIPEQWQMTAASLQILQEVCTRPREEDLRGLASQQCFNETLKWKNLKLEPPALRSDHGTDCRRIARRVRAFLQQPVPNHGLPLHPVDASKGEGLEFPETMAKMDKQQVKTIEQEHLEVTRDTLMYLMQSLRSDLTDDDRRELAERTSPYQGIGATDHLTPPLSPMIVAHSGFFVPEDTSCELPEPSDPSSRLSDDIEAAESHIFESDLQFWEDAAEEDGSPERYDDIDVPDMIRAGEFRPPVQTSSPQPVPRDLRVDVPLLPCNDNSDNTLARTRILAPEDLAEAKELVASSDTLSGSDGPTGQLVTFFLEKATSVMRRAEQEKLQSLDATSRVPVPVLDFSVPAPEWDQRLWEPRAMFRWIQRDIDVDWKGPKWPHNRVAEQRMVWAPLAHMKEKTLVSERIAVDDETLRVFLQRSRDEEVLTSSDYVYKHPGLAILRMEDDEEEEDDDLAPLNLSTHTPTDVAQPNSLGRTPSLTEPDLALQGSSPVIATPPTQLLPDLPSLLSGRKTLIDKALETRWPSRKRERGTASTPEVSATEIIDSALIPSTNVLRGFMSEYTDFAPLVDNFVEMNFPKKQKLTHSPFFGRAGTTPATAQQRADEAAKLMPPPPKPIPALAPDVIPPRIPPRIVVFSTVSKPLTQALEKLLPDLELIPRAHDRHRPPGWRPGMRSPNLDEADIVVSPATGILLTTMVQLRQRPVPGCQPGNIAAAPTTTPMTTMSSFCQVVANVSARHERLVVLVSEGNKHSETASPLSQSDARALAEFQGFAAGLRTADVQVVYVAGGVETLAKWVAATICRHAGEAEAVRDLLLPVETLWEVFLRRAGMDVFAAQVVLGRLKMPEDRPAVGGGDGQVFGLPLFVMMSKERRIELFEGVFGGRRMLERVSEVIDEPWGQWAVDELDFALGTQPSLEKFYDAL